jgi:sporulation protein YabP
VDIFINKGASSLPCEKGELAVEDKRRDLIPTPHRLHQVVLKERGDLLIDGVENVENFDDQEILVETATGMLLVRGRELHIKQLDLDGGTLAVEGLIIGLEYTGEAKGKKSGGQGVLGKLFR